MTTALGSEQWAIVGVIDPDAYGAGTELSDEIDMSLWSRLICIVQIGTSEATSTVDFKLQDSDASGGTFTDISGKATTQFTAADDDKQSIINLRFDEMNDDARYVRADLTVATAASDASCIIMGYPRYFPASDNDLASVDEIVN